MNELLKEVEYVLNIIPNKKYIYRGKKTSTYELVSKVSEEIKKSK